LRPNPAWRRQIVRCRLPFRKLVNRCGLVRRHDPPALIVKSPIIFAKFMLNLSTHNHIFDHEYPLGEMTHTKSM